ncbi:xylulokinase [Staphylococcus carnosus]|uniref:Xylulose kinase n=1 Tax=Staphylococcus carnosus TaxID=1281 RepID=A0AAJ0JPY7_STACA|nr:xylulokinase [Staphylococcus carnosus]KKB25848.1 xylulose kinase [Staphylococcus carnosus]POA00948.1 xylulokinase [Staphylococcus carnosus]QQS84372.1 xylulokinase [Staphylococcus carnosus]QRQ04312.1 xylulokinase [Staphylococcus carnosus]UTB83686.1 xylulokinase [Staphylococcus carnosus]
MGKEAVLGIDLGTSAIKLLAVAKDGEVLGVQSEPLSLYQEYPGYSEQNPDEWNAAMQQGLKNLLIQPQMEGVEIKGVSFSGQMHGLVLLDETGRPLRNAILWNDTRTTPQCETIKAKKGEQVLGNPVVEGFTLTKLLWVKENEPELWKKAATFLLPKDYLRYCLTGEIYTEYSDAAATMLLNPQTKAWDKMLGEEFGIPDIYPDVIQSHDEAGTFNAALAAELGLDANTPVFAGGADNACGALGSGVIRPNDAICSIGTGTSGVLLICESIGGAEGYGHKIHLMNHAVADVNYLMGVTLSAGYSLSWFKREFYPDDSFEKMLEEAQEAGIGGSNTRGDFARAVVEGITYSLYDSLIYLRGVGKNVTKIVSTGGGAKSNFWLQLQADVFNAEIYKLKHEEGPSMGAAMLAAYGLGWYPSLSACAEQFIHFTETFKPDLKRHKTYERYFRIYHQAYKATRRMTKDLLELQKD